MDFEDVLRREKKVDINEIIREKLRVIKDDPNIPIYEAGKNFVTEEILKIEM
jgi:hypothetical protein